MPPLSRLLLVLGAISLASATMLSAYGFHGLPGTVPEAKLASWGWANQLHFIHSLGLLAIGLLLRYDPRSLFLRAAAALLAIGLILFCAGIYAGVLGAPAAIGEVAPLGGSAFMLGWVALAIAAVRMRS